MGAMGPLCPWTAHSRLQANVAYHPISESPPPEVLWYMTDMCVETTMHDRILDSRALVMKLAINKETHREKK